MRYLCVHCDHRFEVAGDVPPTRCPSCMRAKSIEPIRAAAPAKKVERGKTGLLLGGLAALLALGAAAWYLLPRDNVDKSGAGALTHDALKRQLAEQHIDAGGLVQLLVADDTVKKFAEQSAADKEGARAAEAIYAALRKRASAQAFVPWSLGELRATPVLTATQTLAKLLKDNGRAELYPLEVVALAVAALRSLDVPARVAELTDLKGRSSPLDPSGFLGYFVVALESDGAAPRLYDVYGGQSLTGASHALLSDTSALGAALALRALHETTYLADPKRALESSSHALRLAVEPAVRAHRARRGGADREDGRAGSTRVSGRA